MKRKLCDGMRGAGRTSGERGRLRRDGRSRHQGQHDRRSAQKIYVQNGTGRFVDAEGRATLIKGDTMYIIDDKDKSYVVFDKATMEQLAQANQRRPWRR